MIVVLLRKRKPWPTSPLTTGMSWRHGFRFSRLLLPLLFPRFLSLRSIYSNIPSIFCCCSPIFFHSFRVSLSKCLVALSSYYWHFVLLKCIDQINIITLLDMTVFPLGQAGRSEEEPHRRQVCSVCPSVRLSVCPSVRLSVSVCPSVRLSVCPSVD